MPGDENVPRATYRLQLTPDFGFAQAAQILPYLRELGVSHVYLSPVLQAAPGSSHGYDVVDPTAIDQDRGGADAFMRLLAEARELGLRLLVDIVPNHVSTEVPANRYWWDVLRLGRHSPFAAWFDVDWDPPDPDLRDKVLLPVLARPLDEVLDAGEARVVEGPDEPVLEVAGGLRLPLSPESVEQSLHQGPVELLLEAQHYRLEFWRAGLERLNWRRFFDVSGLIGVCVEDPGVFEATHALILEHVGAGRVHGLRVDHPDGLRDPAGYFQRLRSVAPESWILAEKILGPDEELPSDWPVHGTTGYDFMRVATGLFVDPDAEPALDALAREFGGSSGGFARAEHEAKRQVLAALFPAELRSLTHLAREATGAAQEACGQALTELLIAMPVYRTYRREGEAASAADRRVLETALPAALREASGNGEGQTLKRLHRCLLDGRDEAALEFVARFQQVSAALTAKGVEDTAFYRFRRLLCLNEVGGDPGRFGVVPGEFHEFCRRRAERWPLALNAGSTHDSKRSEDVRCRIAALSEAPEQWAQCVRRWRARHGEAAPDDGMQYYLYQTLVGGWPVAVERVAEHVLKAAREAKQHTSWRRPDPEYEAALLAFAKAFLGDDRSVAELETLVAELEPAARRNSLASVLLACTAPGVPDVYQGCEVWNRSLTDPDNRRPVDYGLRRDLLAALRAGGVEAAGAREADGGTKLWLLHRALAVRAELSEAFAPGADYRPLRAAGPHADRVLAFARADRAVTVVPRLTLGLAGGFEGTVLELPPGSWRNALTGQGVRSGELDELLEAFPVALLVR